MSDICIIVPEATINIVHNPRFEYGTGGYTQVGSVLTRSLVRARFGRASGRVVTNNVATLEGAYVLVNPNDNDEPYTGSVYARGAGRVRARLRDQTNGLEWMSDPVQLNDQRWHRFEVSGVVGILACGELRLYIETVGVQNVTFYIDGFQIEKKNYATTYTDGDLELELDRHDGAPYFEWAGERHNSNSHRTDRYGPAGKTVKLTQGLDHRLYPISVSGFGMPPINLNVQHFSGQERALVQGSRALPRAVQLTCWAVKDPVSQVCVPTSLRILHRAREALEAVIKPDRVAFDQPFLLRYLDSLGPMDLEAYYESGLEFSGDLRYPFENSFGVRLLCPDPYWKEDNQDCLNLTASQAVADANYVLMRKDGEWQAMGTGSDNEVYEILVHSSGWVFVGGAGVMGGVSARFGRWDGSAWIAHAANRDPDDGRVTCIAEGPDGTVYLGGTFVNIDAIVYNCIAKYNPTTGIFSTMGTGAPVGLNGEVRGIAVAADGMVYITGAFTQTADALTALNYVASYNPVTNVFAALGAAVGLDSDGWCVEIDIDGETVYFGGDFTDVNGGPTGTYDYVIQYNPAADIFQNMAVLGGGMDARVRVLRRDLEGGVYAGGDFTEAGFARAPHGGAEKIAYWNRKEWYPLGFDDDGMDNSVREIAITDKGLVVIAGWFTSATEAAIARYLASWNKTRFSHWDVVFEYVPTPANTMVKAVAVQGDDLYVGGIFTAATASEIHTAVNNGKASSWPILDILGPARLEWLENQDTGAVVKMDLEVQSGEYMFIDFRRGKVRAYSFFRGNVIAGVLADSDIGAFRMLPGDNTIAFLAEDTDEYTEITLRWATRHWSFDAT